MSICPWNRFHEHMPMEPVPWAYAHGTGSRGIRAENISWRDPQDLGFWIVKIRNHEKHRKWTNMPLPGLRIRPNRSPGNFLSIGTPPRPPKSNKKLNIRPLTLTSKFRSQVFMPHSLRVLAVSWMETLVSISMPASAWSCMFFEGAPHGTGSMSICPWNRF